MKYKVKTTRMQRAAINGVLEGKPLGRAMLDVGYSKLSAKSPKQNLLSKSGVQTYVSRLDAASKKKFNMCLSDKLADTTLNGLDATRLFGKNAIEYPDWSARAMFVKMLSEIIGATKIQENSISNNQYNFFKIDDKQRSEFNMKLKEFLRKQTI